MTAYIKGCWFNVWMDSESRVNLRLNFIGILYDFASPDRQRLWVTGHPDIIVTFTETMCGWFDDLFCVGGIDGAVRAGLLSAEEAAAVREFNDVADAYEQPPGTNEADVLRDPRWAEVVQQAQRAWQALRQTPPGRAELQQMDELEQGWGAIPVQ